MERLTKRLSSGAPTYNYPASCYFGDDSGPDRIAQSAFRQRCVERLADYEDTGRTPEEVTALGNLFDYALEESKTLTEQLALLNRIRELAEADKNGCVIIVPCKVGDTVYFALLGKIIEKQVFSIVAFSNSTRIYCGGTSEYFRPEDIGKTFFLTREEAEKALEAMKNE
jgi:hypothetical protein|nr:MAG TPA: hypothetical protein [Caudoviricetes sp.]